LIFRKPLSLLSATGVLAALLPANAFADSNNSNKVDVALTANVLQSLSLVVALPTVAFGNVTPGTVNNAALPLSIITSWNLGAGQTVKLYAYFDSASVALTGALTGRAIPTSVMSASFNGGASQTFTGASPFTTGSTAMTLYSVPVTTGNLLTTRTDSLAMTMDLTGQTSLPTDSYTGTMHLQAQAL
jgi:hypothetical protein